MLRIDSLTYRIGGRLLFNNASISIAAGQRVGLVGRNGSGKTTLFNLVTGELHPDDGKLSVRSRTRIGRLTQDMPDSTLNLIDYVLASDQERHNLLAAAESNHDMHQLAEIHERLVAIDAASAPSRAASILAGLGFDKEAQNHQVNSFSGGWRMRVALAGTLFARPDLLLLDEPTNHLDLEASLWLENYLGSYEGTLILISHDRDILNSVARRIIHIDQGKLVAYGGNYDRFEQVRREKIELLEKTVAKQAEERQRFQAFIDRFHAKASKASQARSRVKMLERLGPPITVIEESPVNFDFPDPEPLPSPLVLIEKGKAGYDSDHPVLSNLSLRIDSDDRIALLGANGNGKSTLAKILSGHLSLLFGEMQHSSKLRIGYFAQDQADLLVAEKSAYNHLRDLMPALLENKLRAQLGRFGFTKERANIKAGNLSGGEKARLLLALMSRNAPHLIILDEPTNHLDIDSRSALVQALNSYNGAVLLISHDARLIELVADSLWLVEKGSVSRYDGNMVDYRKLLLAGDSKKSSISKKNGSDNNYRRNRLVALHKRSGETEKKLRQLQKQKQEAEEQLADPAIYVNDSQLLIEELHRKTNMITTSIEESEDLWLAIQGEIEAMTSGRS